MRGADACGQQNALGPGLQRDLAEAVAGVFPQADYMRGIESAGTAPVYQAQALRVSTAEPGSSANTLA